MDPAGNRSAPGVYAVILAGGALPPGLVAGLKMGLQFAVLALVVTLGGRARAQMLGQQLAHPVVGGMLHHTAEVEAAGRCRLWAELAGQSTAVGGMRVVGTYIKLGFGAPEEL